MKYWKKEDTEGNFVVDGPAVTPPLPSSVSIRREIVILSSNAGDTIRAAFVSL